MDHLFNNMLPREIALFIMGIVTFLVLLFLLVWIVMKKGAVNTLLPFFLVPVVMVAYPTIKSISIGGIVIQMNNLTAAVSKNPADTASAKSLEGKLAQIKNNGRLYQNSNALLAVAKAQIALGRYDSASVYLNKAEKINPGSGEVVATRVNLESKMVLKEKFTRSVEALNSQIEQLKQSPGDMQTVNRIEKILSGIQAPVYVNPDEAVIIAKSYAITGNREQSLQIIDKLNTSTGSQPDDMNNLKDSIRNKTYQAQFFEHTTAPEALPASALQNKNLLNKAVISRFR